MSEHDRHSRRRSRYEHSPDPDDRYDPRQGAKRARTADLSPDLGPPRRPISTDADFSDRYEPQLKPDISERSEGTRRSRSKERAHSSRDRREHTSSRSYRDHDSSRSRHRSHHSPDRGPSDRHSLPDSRAAAGSSATRSPRQASTSRPDQPESRPGWQGNDMGGRGPGNFSDRGGFGRGGGYPSRGFGRGRGHFDGPGFQGIDGGSMADGGRGGRGGFVPRGRFGPGRSFGGRFEGGGRMDGGRFDGSFRGRGPPFRGRGGRAGDGPLPFSRGQEGPVESGPFRSGPGSDRGPFLPGGQGPPPDRPERFADHAFSRKPTPQAVARLRQQASQLRVDADALNPRIVDAYQKALQGDDDSGKITTAADPPQISSAYMYSIIHSEQPSTAVAAGKGIDTAAFDAAVELYQRPHAAQWMRPSKHGSFMLTSVQIMTNV